MTCAELKIALLVPSCDSYADVWPPLFYALEKFWPACGVSKYLVTNRLTPQIENVNVIPVGQDVSWSDNLQIALKQVSEPYVLLNIDDLILCEPVDHSAVMHAVLKFIEGDGNYLRLNPTPSGSGSGDLREVLPGEIYRSSTVFSIWRKEVLQSVLKRGESAWHFEIHGSVRTDNYDKWFAARRPLLQYVNLIIKGKVDPRALMALRQAGLVYQSNRSILSREELLLRWLKEKRSQIFSLLPRRSARLIRNMFKPL